MTFDTPPDFFRATLAALADAVIATDAAGAVAYLNPAAEALTGWPAADAVGRPLAAVFRAADEAAGRAVLTARDGTATPVELHAAPVRDAGTVVVFRDASARLRAECELGTLAAIVASSDDAIVSKTLDGVIVSWNAGAERVFGYPAAEAVGRPITLIIPPEHLAEEADIIARIRRGERVGHFETTRVAKGGRRVTVSLAVSPVRDAAGRVVGASKVARDVSPRRESEAALRAAEERFEFVRRSSGVGFWYCDLPFDVLEWDERVKAHFHLPPDARVTIDTFYDRIHPADREATRAAIARSIAERESYDVLYRTVSADGGAEKWVRAIGRTGYAADGTPARFDGVTLDVTEQRRAEDELRAADRRKDEFLATLAHELRNPLAPIRTGVQVLKAGPTAAEAANTLAMMERQAGHLAHLVDDLMDVARVTSGKITLRSDRLDLRAAVTNAVEAARPLIDASAHALAVSLPGEPLAVVGDATRLVQVLTNLLTNAAKYTDPGGRIAVTAARDGDAAVVRVADTGVGIPAAMLPRVFDMFAQVGTSLERSQGGLGIGLTLVRRLVEMHGGTATAASGGEGAGSTFTVRLPLVAGAAPVVPAAATSSPAVPLTILVVDDNCDAAESMALLLRLVGHTCWTAHSGPEAVAAAGTFRPAVIFLDIGLPGMSGYDVARALRRDATFADTAIVALTGWGGEEDRRKSREAGCDAHLTKPVDVAEVWRLLAERGRDSGVRDASQKRSE